MPFRVVRSPGTGSGPAARNGQPIITYELFAQERQTGGIAQLGERLICIQEVIGSIPFTSTILECGRVAQLVRARP